MLNSRLAIGTVQFGLDYGINNKSGKPGLEKITEILETAEKQQVNMLDTAVLYGNSEEVIGQLNNDRFQIVSKLPDIQTDEVRKTVEQSLEKLQISQLYGYLLHDLKTLYNSKSYEILLELKQEGIIGKTGFSLYQPADLDRLLNDRVEFDLIQIPFNLFDQRFLPYFEKLEERNIEIHTRSVFLQGLFFMDLENLPSYFNEAKPKLQRLRDIAESNQLSIAEICLNYSLAQPEISKVIIGVDNKDQLEKNIKALSKHGAAKQIMPALKELAHENEQIIIPSNWKV